MKGAILYAARRAFRGTRRAEDHQADGCHHQHFGHVCLRVRPMALRRHQLRGRRFPTTLIRAMDNGLTQEQAAEVITHLAFYAGWPNEFSALPVAKQVFEKRPQ